ncbi:N-acetylornithine carbamoyltransferase (plasmid) [Fulvitalea axinellae]|uniref:N-succinylornithine carbamoyltransferase n=1 Tax=Fulvitalea axinellae TaxID=1182444 RepID=A0AAU9D177_9BACT|nr:N-acetylornithine carbamoyltransferase [Fulvitalea axinellae]
MKQFTSVHDVADPKKLVESALELKASPYAHKALGKNKTVCLIFLNPSLRTRLSTQKAAMNLGMEVMVFDINEDGWKLEFEDGVVMNGDKAEHVKEAVRVVSLYCDIIGVRTFAGLQNREEDYAERILNQFIQHSSVPVVSLESAIRHPLQSLADMITIYESGIVRPKIAVTWAPHVKPLPQAVGNSFLEWAAAFGWDITLANPKGYNPAPEFLRGVKVTHEQAEALDGADFVYAKSWSSYDRYGKLPGDNADWTVTQEKMSLTNNGKFMHCLPLRRNLVASDSVVDNSIVLKQAENRIFAAQSVMKEMLENN